MLERDEGPTSHDLKLILGAFVETSGLCSGTGSEKDRRPHGAIRVLSREVMLAKLGVRWPKLPPNCFTGDDLHRACRHRGAGQCLARQKGNDEQLRQIVAAADWSLTEEQIVRPDATPYHLTGISGSLWSGIRKPFLRWSRMLASLGTPISKATNNRFGFRPRMHGLET